MEAQPPQERRRGREHERDVLARDGEQMGQPRSLEPRRGLRVDASPVTDHEPQVERPRPQREDLRATPQRAMHPVRRAVDRTRGRSCQNAVDSQPTDHVTVRVTLTRTFRHRAHHARDLDALPREEVVDRTRRVAVSPQVDVPASHPHDHFDAAGSRCRVGEQCHPSAEALRTHGRCAGLGPRREPRCEQRASEDEEQGPAGDERQHCPRRP